MTMVQNSRLGRVLLIFVLAWFHHHHGHNHLVFVNADTTTATVAAPAADIVVVGSVNADTFLPVSRLPQAGENLTLRPGMNPSVDVPGGKGCTQAVAASKLHQKNRAVAFVGQFGNDSAASVLRSALEDAHVDLSYSKSHQDLPSGRGYVFLTPSGSVSAVVSGGSNAYGWGGWKPTPTTTTTTTTTPTTRATASVMESSSSNNAVVGLEEYFDELLANAKCVLLQREVPEFVNLVIASEVAKRRADTEGDAGIVVLQDIGGEDRPMTTEMMSLCDYLIPNETELKRLLTSLEAQSEKQDEAESDESTKVDATKDDETIDNNVHDDDDDTIIAMAKTLQQHGARNVLVTRGSKGATLVTESGEVLHQPACTLVPDDVIDETGAGDCFRAAFAVGLLEGMPLDECLRFATGAGACSVTKAGAVPSTPSREEVLAMLDQPMETATAPVGERRDNSLTTNNNISATIPRGGGNGSTDVNEIDKTPVNGKANATPGPGPGTFPFLIGSRLNSMKDRPELWDGPLNTPKDFVARQATIRGLTCVDFNWPQHFASWTPQEAKTALDEAGLRAGSVCLRYPTKFARGAMNHPDAELRKEAIDLTKQAAEAAIVLGCNEVVVWSAFDGYDYPFQVNYDDKWSQLVTAFRDCCDAYPSIRFSIEYKPTDENTRFFTVPSTGAAILLVNDIDRPNMGLTLDVGHMLMSGENPGQSIAMAGSMSRLFGIQLNDGYTRLAAEDGMMFGSIHPSMALEIMYQLKKVNFDGHLYFDTFPQRSDPVREAEYNIKRVKTLWSVVETLVKERHGELHRIVMEHDAIGALELVDRALSSNKPGDIDL